MPYLELRSLWKLQFLTGAKNGRVMYLKKEVMCREEYYIY